MTRCIVAGSRECSDLELVSEAIEQGLEALDIKMTELVSGRCRGVDQTAEEWAQRHGVNIVSFPAAWNDLKQPNANIKSRWNKWKKRNEKYNANAGFYRNEEMANYADALIAIDLGTGGTNHMIKTTKAKGLKVHVWTPPPLSDDEFEYQF